MIMIERAALYCSFSVVCSDFVDFMEDLEEDPLTRKNVNIFKGLD